MAVKNKNIYQKVNEIMKEISYLKKDTKVGSGGWAYSAITHDKLSEILHPFYSDHGIVVFPSIVEGETTHGFSSKGTPKVFYEVTYEITFVNIDNPDDRIVMKVGSHAEDSGDKAAGKALSYAVKMATLKLFSLSTGDREEERFDHDEKNERNVTPEDNDSVKKLEEAINKNGHDGFVEAWKKLDQAKRASISPTTVDRLKKLCDEVTQNYELSNEVA